MDNILSISIPWAEFGFELSFRMYHFNAVIASFATFFVAAIVLYSSVWMRKKPYAKQFYLYLALSYFFILGAVFADNLIAMLFFWEGLLITLFAMIVIGHKGAFRTATKAFVIVGISDLLMMAGIALCGYLGKTFAISQLHLDVAGLGGLAFIFLTIGAIAKAGSMPFHTWIPDAAIDAPLPFMAVFPAALEKLVGIYFLTRISLDIFKVSAHSWASTLLMTIGAVTILGAVAMALVQKNYKKLLAYHAISQAGYMILGIGTMVPVGIIGGIFHMFNNALYKCGLFLTGGAVEHATGSTDLEELGGLKEKMPWTFWCYVILAASISGVPPFNGFFSKELVYDGALERGKIFYFAALLGSFLTAASFLKLGHAAFLGKAGQKSKTAKEAPMAMLIPIIVIAVICIFFGICNTLPIRGLIQPVLGEEMLEGHAYGGMPSNMLLVALTVVVLAAAFLNHLYGVKKTKDAIKAVDHIHNAPGLHAVYGMAEKRWFDPYNIGKHVIKAFSFILWGCDRVIDWAYNYAIPGIANGVTAAIKRLHNGRYPTYISWSLAGMVAIMFYIFKRF